MADAPAPAASSEDALRARLERALHDQYRILRLLGQGGMGAVYLAREEALERLVAIKVLSGSLDAVARERFRREARNGARLTHAGIVPLHAYGEADGLPYLVMGYVRGETLAARLRRDGRLAPEETRRIVADVAEALDHAHRHGIVHRDVKPDNIMIDDESGRALLTDFGIAKAAAAGQTVTLAGGVVGTPQFMSPEQVSGAGVVDGRSDLYSLGLTAYLMLAGRLPFEGGPAHDVLLRRLTHEPTHIDKAAPGVPDDLAATVMRCLARDPALRWPDARALRDAVATRDLDQDRLPEPLDALDGGAAFLLPFVVLLALGALAVWANAIRVEDPRGRRLLVIPSQAAMVASIVGLSVVVLQLPTLAAAMSLARRRGFTVAQLLRAWLRQPPWWPCLWYPARWRRPGDVWQRLPWPFRLWRTSATVLAAAVVLLLVPAMILAYGERARRGSVSGEAIVRVSGELLVSAFAVVFVLAGVAALTQAPCVVFLRRRGFDTYTLRRAAHALLVAPTSRRETWKRPEVAQLLLPVRLQAAEPTSPAALVSAISELARGGSADAREACVHAADAARRIHENLQALERDLARLSTEADAAEVARVDARLAALGDPQRDDDEHRRLRALLTEQRELMRRMSARHEEAQAGRDHMAQALRELWRAVIDLRGAPAGKEAALAERLRARCRLLEGDTLKPPAATATRTG